MTGGSNVVVLQDISELGCLQWLLCIVVDEDTRIFVVEETDHGAKAISEASLPELFFFCRAAKHQSLDIALNV